MNESTAYRIIRQIEDALIKSRTFTLTGKNKLRKYDDSMKVVVIDVTESPIERPKKNIHVFYSGKKKQHTFKSHLVVNQANGEIICTAHGKGREDDFKIFNQGNFRLTEHIECLGDKGYQGIQKFPVNSRIPKKKPLLR